MRKYTVIVNLFTVYRNFYVTNSSFVHSALSAGITNIWYYNICTFYNERTFNIKSSPGRKTNKAETLSKDDNPAG